MAARLVNVRLDEEHLRKARALRERGLSLSDVVREAIDARYGELRQPVSSTSVRDLVARIFDEFPDPDHLPARTYDVHDRSASRAAIRRALGATKP